MNDIKKSIEKEKIIAILRGIPAEKMQDVITALYKGGIRLLEITFNQSSPEKLKETPDAIRLAKELYPDMSVGAGTVMSVEEVLAAKEAGAEFILAPNVNREVIETAVKSGMTAIPGALTPTEIADAYQYGAEVVKLFPAAEMGVSYVKAVRAPISHVPLIAVGGVDKENLKTFLDAGYIGAGIGSCLTDKTIIREGRWEDLTRLAAEYLTAAK